MSKTIKIKAKFEGKEEEHYNIKKTNDNSQIVIPKKNNKTGSHISVHPTGVINLHLPNLNRHNILSKLPSVEKELNSLLNKAVFIEEPTLAVILDYGKITDYAKIEGDTHTIDMDSFFKDSEWINIKDKNLDFVKEHFGNSKTIVIFDLNNKSYFAVKNRPGYGIPFSL